MNGRLKQGVALTSLVGAVTWIGVGCLTRPVEHSDPTTKTNFQTQVSNQAVDKVDLLFMIDNSTSMGDKQSLLALAVPDMINRFVTPNCVDANGNATGTSADAKGTCPANSSAEFPPVHDMHIGILSSSLGDRGGDTCVATTMNPDQPTLSAHMDDRGELLNRAGTDEHKVPDATSASGVGGNFLAWFPAVQANAGVTAPPVPAITAVGTAPAAGATPVDGTLIGDFADMIIGVHEHGCGFEAQNEAWYRFLVQPDPYNSIVKNGSTAAYQGIDANVIQQRHDFLRPDSLVAVIVVTDENQQTSDPLAVSGLGYLWEVTGTPFPGSKSGGAPEGTIECSQTVDPMNAATTGPYGANCQSCGFTSVQSDPNFATRCPKDGTAGAGGYLDPTNDEPNVRFFEQKRRYGVNAGYTSSRYVRGLTKFTVPDSAHEHDKGGNYIGDQDANANCVNPLYATNLPTDPTADLCHLTRGTRTTDLVFYAAITGVPHQLLQVDPTNPDSPQKDTLAETDWALITGADPEHYDFTGADFHMIESEVPRTLANLPPHVANASQCDPANPATTDTCDPINGREWNTNKEDLQWACIFQLPAPKDCTNPAFAGACDCQGNEADAAAPIPSNLTQLCQKNGANYTTTQEFGKAYPGIQHLVIAHALKNQGIVSSLCPIHVQAMGADDPLFGYRPAVTAIVNRLKNALNNTCLPQKLQVDEASAAVPCLLLVSMPAGTAGTCLNPGDACTSTPGLQNPDPQILATFCANAEQTFNSTGGAGSGQADPANTPVCQLNQLTPAANPQDFDATGSCASSSDPGWCYVTGPAAKTCPQAILFTASEPPHGATVNLECIEQSVTVVSGGSTNGD